MSAFHSAFEAALSGSTDALLPHLASDARTLAAIGVYRNTALKARIDALEASYPTVVQMVGSGWFRAAAREFALEHPGDDPVMVTFGAGFPEWLLTFEPARDMPYLAPCARLDRAWTEAHVAADAAAMTPAEAADLGVALTGLTMGVHPSVRLFRFDWTVPSLWLAHRYPQPPAGPLVWEARAEALMIHRTAGHVRARLLTPAEFAFLDACRNRRPLGIAADQAARLDRTLSIPALFASLIAADVFLTPEPEVRA
ncbi:putative DNA-binding domain-containing protein [Brevundimonas sp.]|uniref:HvfC/BufC family peptide modification chaperone n=1 Tax=Brevundimonas sp. TaxID=1871086 RepID=UPI003AF5CC57